MTVQITWLLAILSIAVVLFLSEKLRPDLIALLVMLTLALAGLLTPQQAFSGLSNPAVILIIAVFVLTGGLFRTGVSAVIGRWLVRAAGQSEARLVALVMLASAGLSLVMNNIASAAVIMPAVMDATQRTRVSPSKVLLPMALATQLGGMATLLTTANIVASGALHDAGLPGFGLFDFAVVGGVAALAGIAYTVFAGRRALPDRRPLEAAREQHRVREDLMGLYRLRERLQAMQLDPGSPLVGRSLAGSGIGHQWGLSVVGIERDGRTLLSPSAGEVLRANDVLLIAGRGDQASQLLGQGVRLAPAVDWEDRLDSPDVELLEVMVAPRSRAIGKTLKGAQFRAKYGLSVVALWRGERAFRTGIGDLPLRGDEVLLVLGHRDNFNVLRSDPDWLVLSLNGGDEFRGRKMGVAVLVLVVSLVLAAVGRWPVSHVLSLGALGMVLAGCLTTDEAYASIDWRSVFLVGGMLPVGVALTGTGAAQLLGTGIIQTLGGLGPRAVIAGLFLVTAALNQFIPGGSAIPAVLTPIAIAAARHLGGDPRAFALVVAIATGTSMLTPFAHPVNVLVMGPGGYRFRDYLRAGLPLVAIAFAVALVILPVFWQIGG